MTSDSELLRCYTESNSEDAFAELVRRHLDLVYSAANRMVHDPHLAEDVVQQTFVLLAHKATLNLFSPRTFLRVRENGLFLRHELALVLSDCRMREREL